MKMSRGRFKNVGVSLIGLTWHHVLIPNLFELKCISSGPIHNCSKFSISLVCFCFHSTLKLYKCFPPRPFSYDLFKTFVQDSWLIIPHETWYTASPSLPFSLKRWHLIFLSSLGQFFIKGQEDWGRREMKHWFHFLCFLYLLSCRTFHYIFILFLTNYCFFLYLVGTYLYSLKWKHVEKKLIPPFTFMSNWEQ